MRLVSRYLFADPTTDVCRRFVGRLFEVEEVKAVEVSASRACAHIEYTNGVVPARQVVAKIAGRLRNGQPPVGTASAKPVADLPLMVDGADAWRVQRHGERLSTWEVVHELPGRVRLRNPLIRRNAALCATVDRTLARTAGIEGFKIHPHTATVVILFDPRQVRCPRLVEHLDQALLDRERGLIAVRPSVVRGERRWSRRDRYIAILSLGVSGLGDLVYPGLSLLAAPGVLYTARDTFRSGARPLVRERKVVVDTLVSLVIALSVVTGDTFFSALHSVVSRWTRDLLHKVKRDSRAAYTDMFRQQARTVWVRVDGVEVETPLDAVKVDDVVAITAGQTIPVDGSIAEGAATIDQHLLTGEAAPAERGIGDPVFALTVVLSGKIWVRVEKTGAATAAAHIGHVLDHTVDFKTGRQLRAERVGERLVAPALLSGAAVWPLLGFDAAAGLVDAHPKNRLTLASTLGILNHFRLAARQGLLIKDGRTLEYLSDVDTVVFDKTGTLTLAEPHVRRLHACPPYGADDVLVLAAAAERRQSHPIARAILEATRARKLSIPAVSDAEYRIGYGLTVAVAGATVTVGSLRMIETQSIPIPGAVVELQAECHRQGHSLVVVAVDGRVAGAIELHASIRPEARRIVDGLRARGLTSMYIISGDHEAPTRRLATALGIEHYFAETLPEDKALLIERLAEAGRVICYVGDGINDSIAMKKSHVSVSLRGASSLATDTAEVVLLDESLNQFCRLFDIARESRANARLTMAAVFLPSIVCLGGVLMGTIGLAGTRLLNVGGLAAGVGAAMLPLLTHRDRPAAADPRERPASAADLAIEEHVIPASGA